MRSVFVRRRLLNLPFESYSLYDKTDQILSNSARALPSARLFKLSTADFDRHIPFICAVLNLCTPLSLKPPLNFAILKIDAKF